MTLGRSPFRTAGRPAEQMAIMTTLEMELRKMTEKNNRKSTTPAHAVQTQSEPTVAEGGQKRTEHNRGSFGQER